DPAVVFQNSGSAVAIVENISGDQYYTVSGAKSHIFRFSGGVESGRFTPTGLAITGAISATGTVTGSNLSGTHSGTSSGINTGDQMITLTGDVTGTGTGTFAATVAVNAITYAKFQQVAASSL